MKIPSQKLLFACAALGMATAASAAEYEFSGSMTSSPPDFYGDLVMDGRVKVTYTGTDADTWDLGSSSLGIKNYSYNVNGSFEMNLSGGKIYSQYGGPINLIHFGEGMESYASVSNNSYLLGGGGNVIRSNVLTFENSGRIQAGEGSSSEALYIQCGFGNAGGRFIFTNTGDIISDGARAALKVVNAGYSTIELSGGTISSKGNAIEIDNVYLGTMSIGAKASIVGNICIGEGGLDISIAKGAAINGAITIGKGNTLSVDNGLNFENVEKITMEAGSTLLVSNWDGSDVFGSVDIDASLADVEMKIADGAFEVSDIGTVYTVMSGGSHKVGDFGGLGEGDIYMAGVYEFVVSYADGNVSLGLAGIIPESSAFAAVFGALAFACAACRRQK